jgi:hypothetical protein
MNTPIKARTLHKADREADFLFMIGMMWMGIKCGAWSVAEPPRARQHFFWGCGCWPRGVLDAENFGKLFLSFFLTGFLL